MRVAPETPSRQLKTVLPGEFTVTCTGEVRSQMRIGLGGLKVIFGAAMMRRSLPLSKPITAGALVMTRKRYFVPAGRSIGMREMKSGGEAPTSESIVKALAKLPLE